MTTENTGWEEKESGVVLARNCRCSLVGQQDRKDVCHHSDKACHVIYQDKLRESTVESMREAITEGKKVSKGAHRLHLEVLRMDPKVAEAIDYMNAHFSEELGEIEKEIAAMKKEIGTTEGLKKNGHHTQSVHRKIKYNNAINDVLSLLQSHKEGDKQVKQ